MNWKIALTALATLAAAPSGCGGDDCTTADDHLTQCAPANNTTSSSTGMVAAPACAGYTLCKAQCTNQFTCSQINGNDPSYTSCIVGCNGK